MEEERQVEKPNVVKPKRVPLKAGQAYMPSQGFTYHPALKYGRNKPCLCKSGKKFKNCCLNKLARVISKAEAKKIDQYMKDFQKNQGVNDSLPQ